MAMPSFGEEARQRRIQQILAAQMNPQLQQPDDSVPPQIQTQAPPMPPAITPQAPDAGTLAPRPLAPQSMGPNDQGPTTPYPIPQQQSPQPPTVVDPDTLGPAPDIQGQPQIYTAPKATVNKPILSFGAGASPQQPPGPALATPPLPQGMQQQQNDLQQLRDMINRRQTQQQYEQQHPVSRWRHALAIAGGIGAGIGARDPGYGIDMYNTIQHGRARGADNQWQAEARRVQSRAELDAQQQKAIEEDTKSRADAEAKAAQAEQARATGRHLDAETANVRTFEQEKELEALRHPEKETKPGQQYSVMLDDGTELQPVEIKTDDNGNSRLMHGDAEVPQDRIIDSHKFGEPATPFRLNARILKAERAREGKSFTDKDVQLAVERSKTPPTTLSVQLQQARLDALNAKNRVMSPSDKLTENIVNELVSNPEKASDKNYINPTNRAVVETRYREKTGHGLAIKDTPNLRTREFNATLVDQQLNRIDQIFKDYPELQARIGPLLGNLGKVESMIGTPLLQNFSNDPKREAQIEQAAQEMRSTFRQLALTTAMSEGGGRFGEYLVKATEKMTPDSHMDMNMILGGMNTARQFNEHTVKNTIGLERFGPNWLPPGQGYDTVMIPNLGERPLHTIAADGSHWYYDMDKRKYMPMTTE